MCFRPHMKNSFAALLGIVPRLMIKTESDLRTFSMCVQKGRHNTPFRKKPGGADV